MQKAKASLKSRIPVLVALVILVSKKSSDYDRKVRD